MRSTPPHLSACALPPAFTTPDKTVLRIMRATPGMHYIFAPNFPITAITVCLQDACKFPKELPGALSATIQLKIEHYRSARSAILPEISLVILALGSFGLHVEGRFIGLNVTTAQKFPAHCPDDRHKQFTDSHDPTTERDSGKLQSSFAFQHRALTKQRQVSAVFVDVVSIITRLLARLLGIMRAGTAAVSTPVLRNGGRRAFPA